MKKKISFILITLCAVTVFLTGCGTRLSETTVFYSMVVSPSDYYIRLESDNDFYYSGGLSGTYAVKNKKVTFTESSGGTSTGYLLDGEHLLYTAYDGDDSKVPDGSRFDVKVYDGMRTTITFTSDGTVEKYIYQENIYDFKLSGTYERDGALIHCTFPSKSGQATEQTYGVYDGVLYEVFCSDVSEFGEQQAASISQLDFIPEDEISLVAVVMIVVMLLIIFLTVFLLIYKLQKIGKNSSGKRKSGKK